MRAWIHKHFGCRLFWQYFYKVEHGGYGRGGYKQRECSVCEHQQWYWAYGNGYKGGWSNELNKWATPKSSVLHELVAGTKKQLPDGTIIDVPKIESHSMADSI